jgi:hypothetical protein
MKSKKRYQIGVCEIPVMSDYEGGTETRCYPVCNIPKATKSVSLVADAGGHVG